MAGWGENDAAVDSPGPVAAGGWGANDVPVDLGAGAGSAPPEGGSGSYLLASAKAGGRNLLAAGAKLVDRLNPFTTSEDELAALYKDDPEKLKDIRENGATTFLQRFAREQNEAADKTMAAADPNKKFSDLQYATLDPSKAAYLSPTRVAGDAVNSLPTTAALALTAYLTRGASVKAEQSALAAGATAEAARQAGVQAAVQTAARAGAASEGAVGYAQQAMQTQAEIEKMPVEKLRQSPEYIALIHEGFAPEAARSYLAARAGEQAGVGAGAVDAVTNAAGGKVLGKIIGEGGKLLPRVAKGFGNEAGVEAVQSAGEQMFGNAAKTAADPTQPLMQGAGEAFVQGGVVGGVTGGVTAGVFGRPHAETQESPLGATIQASHDAGFTAPAAMPAEAIGDASTIDEALATAGAALTPIAAPQAVVPPLVSDASAPGAGNLATLPDYTENSAGTNPAINIEGPGANAVADTAQNAQPAPISDAAPLSAGVNAETGEIAPPAPQGFVSREAAEQYLSDQRQRGGSVSGHVVDLPDGTFGVRAGPAPAAPLGRPLDDEQVIDTVLPGDVTAKSGSPFQSARTAAMMGRNQAGTVTQVQGGWVFRPEQNAQAPTAATPVPQPQANPAPAPVAASSAIQPAAGSAPVAAPARQQSDAALSEPEFGSEAYWQQRADQAAQTRGRIQPTNSLARTASWVIKDKTTGKVVMETFDRAKVDALNTAKYEAVPILTHLQSLNQAQATGPFSANDTEVKFSQPTDGESTTPLRGADNPTTNSAPIAAASAQAQSEPNGNTRQPSAQDTAAVERLRAALQRQGADASVLHAVAAPTETTSGAGTVAALAKRLFGQHVVFVEFDGPPLFNGAVFGQDRNTIYLRADASKPHMALLGHEMLHQMRNNAPGLYQQLADRLDALIADDSKYVIRLKAQYERIGRDLPPEVREELHGDIVGDNFTDPAFWDEMAADQPSGFQKVIDYVRQFLNRTLLKARPFATDEFLKDAAAARSAVADALRQFSGAQVGAVTTPGNGVSLSVAERSAVEPLQEHVDAIRSAWKDAPDVQVVPSINSRGVPNAVQTEAKRVTEAGGNPPAAVFYAGKVWLFADRNPSKADATTNLLHEVYGHWGLAKTFGPRMEQILRQVATLRAKDVDRIIRENGFDPSERMRAAEELLAQIAQEDPQSNIVQRAVAAIRQWLRANVPGFRDMDLTDNDIISQYLVPARETVQQGLTGYQAEATPKFSQPAEASEAVDAATQKLQEGQWSNNLEQSIRKQADPGTLNWWHESVGTQFNLAERSPEYKRVFDAVQDYMGDASRYGTKAADKAPNMLPKLDTLKDNLPAWLGGKRAVTAADTKTVGKALLDGTLRYGRDTSGKIVLLKDLRARYDKLDTEKKAQMLLRKDYITEGQLKSWQALPVQSYEGAVRNQFERQFLAEGTVFTDQELRDVFKLDAEQIKLYRESHAAIAESLSRLAMSDMLNYGGKDTEPLRETVMGLNDPDPLKNLKEGSEMLRDYLLSLAQTEEGTKRNDVLIDTANVMIDKADRVRDMLSRGYFPLSRFGQHVLDVTSPTEGRIFFRMYETAKERNKEALRLHEMFPPAEYPDLKVERGTTSEERYKLFSQVSPESIEIMGNILGLNDVGNDVASKAYQKFIKATKNTRSALQRLAKRKGIEGFSDDVGRGLAQFVYSNARLTSQNLHTKAMMEGVQAIPQGQGQLQDQAVKLVNYVRNPQEESAPFRGLLFAQFIGGSLASAMVNLTQPYTVTGPYLSQYGGPAKAAAQMLRAAKDVWKANTGDAKLDAALKDAADRGITAPQEVHQLMAQAMGKGTLQSGDGTPTGNVAAMAKNIYSKMGQAWGKPFSLAEQMNRRITFIAAYRTAVQQDMKDPSKFAEDTVNQTQFISNKGSRPNWARGSFGTVAFTFKGFSIAYIELVNRLWTRGGPKGKLAATYMVGMLFLLAGAGGLPFADDLDDVLEALFQKLGYNYRAKTSRQEFLNDWLGKTGADFVEKGVSGIAGIPIDLSGRLGMGNLIPGTGLLTSSSDHSRDWMEFAGATGDLMKRGFEGAQTVASGVGKAAQGRVGSGAKEALGGAMNVMPTAIRNLQKAYEMYTTGMYKDAGGKKVIDTDGYDALSKAIGFQPKSVATIQGAAFQESRMLDQAKIRKQKILEQWAQGIAERDQAKVEDAKAERDSWNEKNPEYPVKVSANSLLEKVRTMRQSKEQRLAKAAPKELKAGVRRRLAEQAEQE